MNSRLSAFWLSNIASTQRNEDLVTCVVQDKQKAQFSVISDAGLMAAALGYTCQMNWTEGKAGGKAGKSSAGYTTDAD